MTNSDLLRRIDSREATVGVVGLGYVGLPLALTFARKGFPVVGFDVDPAKVTALREGRCYLDHIAADDLGDLVEAGKLSPTLDFARAAQCDAMLLCVPTPLTPNREPDMRFIESTARSIAPHLKAGQLVVLESTTWPGTTDTLLRKILDTEGPLEPGEYLLAYSPEREDPGNPDFSTSRIPKLVGGTTPEALEAAMALYGAAVDEVVPVGSARIAEMTKLYENVFRSVNIALVNELKLLCERMDIDVWEVVDAAATKPFGFMPFYPGPGLGGHCIPIDPFYLTWKAREYGLNTRFIELAGEINTSMPHYVVERTALALNDRGRPLNGAKVLLLGVAYKRDIDDVRESPALRIIELLVDRHAVVSYHDPFVAKIPPTRAHHIDLASVELTNEALSTADAVIIVTDHTKVDYLRVVSLAPLVVDTRNATRSVVDGRDKIVRA